MLETEEKPETFKVLEEDDEFEDFPADNWDELETVGAQNQEAKLWKEDWDDDDNADDFSAKLKTELAKAQA